MSAQHPRLYSDIAAWWPLVSHPDEYVEEAEWIIKAFRETLGRTPATMLELGSGGGNTASHLARDVRMTLVELSPAMLDISRKLNPDVEHVEGDMRSVRLNRTFETVMIHDAIMYMTTEQDLLAALVTARAHLAPSGALMVLPDYVAETFEMEVDTGGNDARDGSGRGVRFMSWSHAPVAGSTTHEVDYAILIRAADGSVELVHDRHTIGLFPRRTWQETFIRAGFAPPTSVHDSWGRDVFTARIGTG